LKTAAVLDYESGSNLSIRVQVRDEKNATEEVNITVALIQSNSEPTGKVYEFISNAGISWTDAKAAADAANAVDPNYFIYLATVTTQAEHDVIEALGISTMSVWLGANDINKEGEWRWTEGPEGFANGGLGTLFWNDEIADQSGQPSTTLPDPNNVVPGFYQNWAPSAGVQNDYFDYLQIKEYPVYDYSSYPPVIVSVDRGWFPKENNPTLGSSADGYLLEKDWLGNLTPLTNIKLYDCGKPVVCQSGGGHFHIRTHQRLEHLSGHGYG
jgi:hypothetical protein